MGSFSAQERFHQVVRGFRAYVEDAREIDAEGFPVRAAQGRAGELATAGAGHDSQGEKGNDEAPLHAIREALGDCRRCKLHPHRTQIVFGVGSPRAELMFVGEGPGEEEDRRGEPFVGRAGQLLTEIITRGMGLRRADVYIANVVKCRPPGNRNPEPDEIAACQPFLERQVEAVDPKVIVALGKFAAQTLLSTAAPISKLRGRWFDFHGRKLMPTFHPSYLLRNPSDKRLVWEDIQRVMGELGLPLPKSNRPGA
jgi:uracil-DNA glycosylase family 4